MDLNLHNHLTFVSLCFSWSPPQLMSPSTNILFCLQLKMVFKVKALAILVSYSVLWGLSHVYMFAKHLFDFLPLIYFQCTVHLCLFVLQFFQVFGKHFSHLLHSFSKILDHLHYHYSEFFFWKIAYLHLVVILEFWFFFF